MQLDVETAAWYLGCAGETAYIEYHLVGKQPMIETQRLTEENEELVAVGQQGEDDSAIQHQVQSRANYIFKVALNIRKWNLKAHPSVGLSIISLAL